MRWRTCAIAIVGLAILVIPVLKVVNVLQSVGIALHPRRGPVGREGLPPELSQLADVGFNAEGQGRIAGWYLAPRNGSAVVFVHGTNADRRQLLPEATLLVRHGFGVLLFDLAGHGESGGKARWGEPERASLSAAVEFLAARPEVHRIGALGFSLGAWPLLQVAVADQRIVAVALEGATTDSDESARFEYRSGGPIKQQLAVWSWRVVGFQSPPLRPIDLVPLLQRPLLIVAGTADGVVPSRVTTELYQAAQEPKELWLITGAGHGGYAQVAGAEYESRLAAFFASSVRAAAR